MSSLRVMVTGQAPFHGTSERTKKPFTVTTVYVKGSKPFPEEIGVMHSLDLPAGTYDVPYSIDVYNKRLQVNFDFKKATLVKEAG